MASDVRAQQAAAKKPYSGIVPSVERPLIYLDTPEGLRLLAQKSGAKLNFLYTQWLQAHATNTQVAADTDTALYTEIADYYGVVFLKEARKRGWGSPGSSVNDRLHINKLLPSTVRFDAAWTVFHALGTFKGRSQFHTWAHKIILNVIHSAVKKEMRVRNSTTGDFPDPNIAGGSSSRMMKNKEEEYVLDGLNSAFHGDVRAREEADKRKAYNDLFAQQSKRDKFFLRLHTLFPGENRKIARRMGWTVEKAYNRKAKFVKLGLLPRVLPNKKKQAYNNRYRERLQMRKTGRLSI